MITWPAGLEHRPRRDAFGTEEPHVAPLETEFEGGAQRRRPTTTLRRATYSFAWDFDKGQFDLFRDFYHRVLVEGSALFEMQVFDGLDGTYVARQCQFKGMYGLTRPAAALWRVTAQIRIAGGVPALPEPEPEP